MLQYALVRVEDAIRARIKSHMVSFITMDIDRDMQGAILCELLSAHLTELGFGVVQGCETRDNPPECFVQRGGTHTMHNLSISW
jgi:hypothetical protein